MGVPPFYIYAKADLPCVRQGVESGCGVDARRQHSSHGCARKRPVYAMKCPDAGTTWAIWPDTNACGACLTGADGMLRFPFAYAEPDSRRRGSGGVMDTIEERVLEAAGRMLKPGATVRKCAAALGVSKTTVHKDLRQRLPQLDAELAKKVDRVLEVNRLWRHIRGGEATRRKYRGS
jgi:putative DeoR family transcriptional regulator (stage III sporulation protein D)